jgi:hypothetical protein
VGADNQNAIEKSTSVEPIPDKFSKTALTEGLQSGGTLANLLKSQ